MNKTPAILRQQATDDLGDRLLHAIIGSGPVNPIERVIETHLEVEDLLIAIDELRELKSRFVATPEGVDTSLVESQIKSVFARIAGHATRTALRGR